MVITFMRQDPNGDPVKVEIAMDKKTGMPIRIRRETTVLCYNNIKVRSDVYWKSEPQEFKKCLQEEISFYEGILRALKKCLVEPETETLQEEEETITHEPMTREDGGDGLAATAARLQYMKEDGLDGVAATVAILRHMKEEG